MFSFTTLFVYEKLERTSSIPLLIFLVLGLVGFFATVHIIRTGRETKISLLGKADILMSIVAISLLATILLRIALGSDPDVEKLMQQVWNVTGPMIAAGASWIVIVFFADASTTKIKDRYEDEEE